MHLNKSKSLLSLLGGPGLAQTDGKWKLRNDHIEKFYFKVNYVDFQIYGYIYSFIISIILETLIEFSIEESLET